MDTIQAAEILEHQEARFPASVEKGEVYGVVDAVMIDADIMGCVSHGDDLAPWQRASLREAADLLMRSLPAFPEDARPFYERLLRIARRAAGGEGTS